MTKRFATICGILAVLVLSAACGGGGPSSESGPTWDDPLQPGITWNLESLNGRPLVYGSSITLTDNLTSGHDSCNNYGMASLRDDQPRFTVLSTASDGTEAEGIFSSRVGFTERLGCGERLEKQADDYHAAVKEGERFHIKGNRLDILNSGGRAILVFVRQPPLPGNQPNLAGTQWRMMGSQKPITLSFLDDKIVAILGECLDFFKVYRTSGGFFEFYDLLVWNFDLPCIEQAPTVSLLEAEQYSVIGEEHLEQLLIGTHLGKTLTLNTLAPVAQDAGQGEWSLKNIVSLNLDDIEQHVFGGIVPGSTVTLNIQENHVTGSAGCNSYQASLEVIEENITIGPPSVTELSCAHLEFNERVMNQESRFLDLLPQITRGVTIADRLFLSTPTGIYLIFEAQ